MDAQYQHTCSIIPDGPSNVQTVLMGMNVSPDPWRHTFYDRIGRSIEVPRNEMNKNKPYFDDGYAKALWDLRNDSMLLGEDERTLYVRDVDLTGDNRLLDSWHAIGSIEDEYHITGRSQVYLPWNVQLRVECSKLARRVRHGVKFRNAAFYRINGRVRRILPVDHLFDDPFEVFMDVDYSDELVAEAGKFLRFVTADGHSAENLGRMFATPLLEPYKHLFYVLYGGGGNGKGILLDTLHRSLPALSAAVTSKTLLGGRNGNGGFATDQEMLKLIGALWAYDEDADTITLEQATLLKKIGTGDTMVARRVQENAVSFRNKATFIIASNNPVIMSMTEALERRRVFVRMKDGRAENEFAELLRFRDEHGIAPFLMASCRLWEVRGDKPWSDVVIGSADDLTEAQQWIVDCIVANGYAVSRDNPFHETDTGHRNTAMKLGLKSKPKRINGEVVRVLVVRNEHVFSVYRDSASKDLAEALNPDSASVPALPAPIEGAAVATPDDCGYPVTFGTVTDGKRSYDWSRNRTLPEGKQPPVGATAYAVVPAAGMAIIDLDVAKDPATGEVLRDAPTGWDVFNREIGEYGSLDFPKTYLVGTPTGRRNGLPSAHAYYMIPPELRGRLKNAVHEKGVPVDIRCEGKGYVVGAGSHIPDGDYLLLDMPDGTPPAMPPRMTQWLTGHGYVTDPASPASAPVSVNAARIPSLSEVMRQPITVSSAANGRPDMTPVPAGSRNNDLHAWAYGRLLNHPENAESIRRDLFERGQASGLPETELTTIWNSIRRQLGGE